MDIKSRDAIIGNKPINIKRPDEKPHSTGNSNSKEFTIKGCKVTLNFLPESNGKTIDTVKNILTSSMSEHCYISSKTA